MIIETKVYSCRKCQSEDLVKNGTDASGSSQYHCKACGAYGVLECKERATEEKKELILSIGIIPYGSSWHASYVRSCLFPNVLKCMRFV